MQNFTPALLILTSYLSKFGPGFQNWDLRGFYGPKQHFYSYSQDFFFFTVFRIFQTLLREETHKKRVFFSGRTIKVLPSLH